MQSVWGAAGPVEAEAGRWVRVGAVQERAGGAGLSAEEGEPGVGLGG